MLKKICALAVICILLVGCNAEEPQQQTAMNDQETVEVEAIPAEIVKKTPKQYVEEFEQAPFYQELIKTVEQSFLQPIDFDGDGISEIVLAVKGDLKTSDLMIYKLVNQQWNELKKVSYETDAYLNLEFVGKLSYSDGSLKEALAFGFDEAAASVVNKSLFIFNLNEKTGRIEELINFYLAPTVEYADTLSGNKMTITMDEGEMQSYTFLNGKIMDQNGKRLGIIIDENLASLVGTTINDHHIQMTDTYHTAKYKIKESPSDEQYYEGAMCAFYDTFFICDFHAENGGMHAYYIPVKNAVTVKDVENVFNETLQIEEWEDFMQGGYSYSAEVHTTEGMYGLTFDAASPNAKLTFISYVPTH